MDTNEKLSYFENEINLIQNEDLRNFLTVAIENLDDYVFIREGSSTGKYHPLSDLGEGGLLRHIKSVFYIGLDLLQLEHYQEMFSEREKDLILISLLLHDAKKYGAPERNRKYTTNDHPLLAANWIKDDEIFNNIIPNKDRIIISNCIAAHSGQWNTNKKGEEILPKPTNKKEFFVHMCDYIASRRYLDIDLSKIDTKTKPAVEPKDFVLDFGQKHKGRTIQEIYEVDPQYLKWAAENMRKEPAHTYIATFMQDK